jgi:endonuclease/exonuclease/phosphatase (EEP) superfamily protein YafD
MAILSRSFRRLAFITALAACIGLVLGFFSDWHPALDSFAHFRAHLAVMLGLAAVPLLANRFLRLGAAALLGAILAFATTSATVLVPGLGMKYGPLAAADPERPTYRLVHLNLLYKNPEPGLVLSMIGHIRPDVLTLNEVSAPWADKLKLISATYRYSIFCPFPNRRWGAAIMSRRPFVEGMEPRCDESGALAIASVNFGGQAADIAALHLSWPWPYPQSRQIEGLSPYLARLGRTAILAGDLNAAPWSRSLARVAAAGGLTLMPSTGATWNILPEFLFFTGLPIDNVFAKGDVVIHSIRKLEPVGSDHLPVLVEFSLTEEEGEPEVGLAEAGSLGPLAWLLILAGAT